MSPPSNRVIDWINKMGFNDREEVIEYVNKNGGMSGVMMASIDEVFPQAIHEMENLPTPQATGRSPLEQLQAGEIPEEQPIEPIQPLEEAIPESIQTPVQKEVKKSLFQRFLTWLGGS